MKVWSLSVLGAEEWQYDHLPEILLALQTLVRNLREDEEDA